MASEFRSTRRVEFADTDCAGIAHFSAFFRYMEEAEHAFLRFCGLSVRWPSGDGGVIGFPRLSARCEYLRAVTFEDSLEIELRVSRLGRKAITYGFEFFHRGTVVARGELVVAACRVEEGRSIEAVPLPASFRAVIEASGRGPVQFRPGGEGGGG
jgi:4-hydroxybenzoyl-CoA thioesterase/acyl-CoA thioester hydrolase